MKKYMIFVIVFVVVSVLLCLLVTVINRYVVWTAEHYEIFDCNEEYSSDKSYDAIVVLGAKVNADGQPSHMLEDRLRAAVALYNYGAAKQIILSGDCSGEEYDEVSAMKQYCINAGVPEEALIRDDIGFSTYETAYNVVNTMGIKHIIVVTQEYHLYRTMFIASNMGAEVDGYTADYRTYFGQLKRDVREYIARTKDFLKVKVSLK